MEENTLQPGAEEKKKPHEKKTKKLKEKNTNTRKNINDSNEDKKSSKDNKKRILKSEKVKEPKTLKKETGKKKIEKKDNPKEKVSTSKTKKTKEPKTLKKETGKKKIEKKDNPKEKVSTSKTKKTKEPKTLKKETRKKKIEKKDNPKEKVSTSKTKKTKEPKTLKKENISSKNRKEEIAPGKEYNSKSIEELIEIFQKLSTSEDWLKNHKSLISINDIFDKKFQLDVENQKKIFIREGGNEIDFFFKPDYKKSFDQITYDYRNKRRNHYKDQDAAQKINLERRRAIIEEIKDLIDQNQINSKTYKEFRKLQESWYNTGQVPRNESQNLWDTFKHHVERFYAFLHLDREFREMDYNHNYQEKIKLIERAEALKNYPDIIKASRDLNILHKQWKNDLGPVAKEHREDLWKRFQNASKEIQERRQEYQKDAIGEMKKNMAKKEELLIEMKKVLKNIPENHISWQNALKNFNILREDFKKIGYIPAKESKASWKSFREVGSEFMRLKNIFYKEQKKSFNSNIEAKKNLINLSVEVLDSENWKGYVQKMKEYQKEWKKIGFVPRKLDNNLWREFSVIQKKYFDRLKSGFQQVNLEQEELLKTKKSYLDKIKKEIFKADPDLIKKGYFDHLDKWNELGTLELKNENEMNKSFTDIMVGKIKKTKLEDKEIESIIKDININILQNDPRRLEYEFRDVKSHLTNLKAELTQLENNLEFFSNSSTENPLFKNVEKQIGSCQKKIDETQKKYISLKQIRNVQNKSNESLEEESQSKSDHELSDSED